MSPTRPLLFGALLTLGAVAAFAGPRSSANYAISTEVIDGGGGRSTSANYSHHASLGGAAAATSTSTDAVLKAGYIGQLTEVTGLVVTAGTTNVNEGTSLQLGAQQMLDDATYQTVAASAVTWNVQGGPIAGISAAGLLTAGLVYQNTPATARGTFGGFSGTLNLMVVDALPDNFGTYAGDGLDDSWQVQYFGLNNPSAAPTVDASGTGQNNLFKFVAGLNPLDPNSRFVVVAAPVTGQPGQKMLTFSPAVAGRIYSIRATADVGVGSWSTLPGSPEIVGSQGTFLDTNAAGPKKFYEVQITKP